MAPTHRCTQEGNISLTNKSIADMDKKIDKLISTVEDMGKDFKATYATKEELEHERQLQQQKNDTMEKGIAEWQDVVKKLAWFIAFAFLSAMVWLVIK